MGIFSDTLDILGARSGTPDSINQRRALLHSPKQSTAQPPLAFFVFRHEKALAETPVRRRLMFLQPPVDSLSEATESEILLRGLSSTPRFIVWVESVKATGLRGRGGGTKQKKQRQISSPAYKASSTKLGEPRISMSSIAVIFHSFII